VHAPAERADTLPLFHLYSCMYSVEETTSESGEVKNRKGKTREGMGGGGGGDS
jgi:hypothetical protein